MHANAAEILCAITRYAPPALASKISSPRYISFTFDMCKNFICNQKIDQILAATLMLVFPVQGIFLGRCLIEIFLVYLK